MSGAESFMRANEVSLRLHALWRRTGLADVPRACLFGILGIALIALLFALWHFWPKPNASFEARTGAQAENEAILLDSTDDSRTGDTTEIVIDVEGAVMSPGLYVLNEDARIGDAIQAAGGFAEDAAMGSLNLAEKIVDGQQVLVLTQKEAEARSASAGQEQTPGQSASGKISINTASAEELQKLNGVGPSLSERIVQYRQSHGPFSSIEDLRNVSGIGETRFANIKDMICL